MLSLFSHVGLCETLRAKALQAPLSVGFSKQEYWSGLPCPPSDLPDPGIEPKSLMSPPLTGGFLTTSATWEALSGDQWDAGSEIGKRKSDEAEVGRYALSQNISGLESGTVFLCLTSFPQ